jgi:hypothetical protein
MKKLLLLLLLSLGFIGTASAHLEDAIFCKADLLVIPVATNIKGIQLQLSVAAQNNTDSSNTAASVGIFSPSDELIGIKQVFSWNIPPKVNPGSTATYGLHEVLVMINTTSGEEADIQADIDHHLQLYTDMYKEVTCKVFGYN